MNTTDNNKEQEIAIDLNLPLLSEKAPDLYQERMMMVYDIADKLSDYCSLVILDHDMVLQTIESRSKRAEEILKGIELMKEFFKKYIKQKEKDIF